MISTHLHEMLSHCIKLIINRAVTCTMKPWNYPLLKEITAVVDRLIIEVAKILHRIQESFVFTGSDHDSLLCE